MKKIIIILSLVLIATFLMPSNLAFASTDSDCIRNLNIRPKNEAPLPGDDSLYYGYVYLDKEFRSDLLNYTATVENDVKNVKIEVRTVGDVTVTGNKEYDLNVGENTIIVVASKSNGTSMTYTIVINRLGSKADNTDLSDLYVIDGNNHNYIKDFDPSITSFNVVVENKITEIGIDGFTSADTSTIKGSNYNYKLKTGHNKFKLTVTSKSGKMKDYIINIERKKSSDVSLLGITVNGEDISLNGEKNLTAKVLYDTSTVDIKAYMFDETIKIKGTGKHKVKVGSNKIKLTVIAEDGSKDVYNLNIIRANPTTELSDLQINQYSCGTDGNKLNLDVNNSTDKVKIQATAVDKSAKVTGNGTYNLKVGKNIFYITVKAANGKTKRYSITINRSKYKNIKIIIIWD